MRAFGGELVNWIGPDGTSIPTVPRYAIESLERNSTWQTIAWNNDAGYINAARNYGIQHPVGMCLQDAGWRNGPWLSKNKKDSSIYITWQDYFQNIAIKKTTENWKLSQEDVQVSLVWGAQVLQRIAQQTRAAENKLITAEKMAVMASVESNNTEWPKDILYESWRQLMLSQHHDCWIVPYNGRPGRTWADRVQQWTGYAVAKSDSIIQHAALAVAVSAKGNNAIARVYNTMGQPRKEMVKVALPKDIALPAKVLAYNRKEIVAQVVTTDSTRQLAFVADVPAFGYVSYALESSPATAANGARIALQADGTYLMESDLYRMVIDPNKGGAVKSLVAKQLDRKEFVDASDDRGFNALRGNFYKEGGFMSSLKTPATAEILENGPVEIKLRITGMIASYPFTQVITLVQGDRKIDVDLQLQWQGNPVIGDDIKPDTAQKSTSMVKGFYDDRYKLLAVFPLQLKGQQVFKNAPFDVTKSALSNTFFNRWDSIKNNIMLNWVDVTDDKCRYGMALFSDHTTTYTHGEEFPLGLNLQYSGPGLWGRNYIINGPTQVHYALVPHKGRWDEAGIWRESDGWNEPMVASMEQGETAAPFSLLDMGNAGWELSAVFMDGDDCVVRLFNAEGKTDEQQLSFGFKTDKVLMTELDGSVIQDLRVAQNSNNKSVVSLSIPKFGVRTLRFTGVKK